MILSGPLPGRFICILCLSAAGVAWQPGFSQSAVSAIFSHPQNAVTAKSYAGTGATGNSSSGLAGTNYTYKFGTSVAATNNMVVVDSFTAYALNYYYVGASQQVKFRRVDNTDATGLRKSLWFEQTGGTVAANGTVSLYPEYSDSLEYLFLQRYLNVGIDNVFQNANTTNDINIERVDVLFPGGVKATDNTKAGFVVFDRGNSGSHDAFYIAAVKTVDGSGNPTAYFPAVSITSANYGSGVGGNFNYVILRKNPADAQLLMMNNSTSQNRDGVFLRFSDLGVASNTVIYGYSLFAPDVTVTPVIKMVSYTTAANFPTNSDLGGGGLDPVAITGLWVTNSSYVLLSQTIDGFRATATQGRVRLDWRVHNTGSGQQAQVERSEDGLQYTTLLRLAADAAEASGRQTAYDDNPLAGKNYYRLRLVDNMGTTLSSSPVSETDMSSANGLQLYPNPVKNGRLHIEVRGLKNETCYLQVRDLHGSLVFHQALSGQSPLQTSIQLPAGLKAGLYMVEILNGSGDELFERRVVVE